MKRTMLVMVLVASSFTAMGQFVGPPAPQWPTDKDQFEMMLRTKKAVELFFDDKGDPELTRQLALDVVKLIKEVRRLREKESRRVN